MSTTTSSETQLAERLPAFFDALASAFAAGRSKVVQEITSRQPINVSHLATFLTALQQPILASRQGAFHFDPWEVAGLGNNEVRNAGVLAWLLNPHGSHGRGFAAMSGLLAAVNNHFNNNFAVAPGQFCRVRTEINPNGEIVDRVDIEIDAKNFYLIIEVKIKAPEQAGQLERYCRQAEDRAGKRPWAVIFLTPEGGKPTSAGMHADSGRIVCLSWKKLATALERELPSRRLTADQPLSVSRQIAEQAARRFLKKIRLF